MRIIAGEAGGRRLASPPGDATRPTSEQIRGAVYNILAGRVQGARVLDLFGGTGAMALEAMSRGAASCVINDPAPLPRRAILKNAEAVLGERRAEACRILALDFRACLKRLKGEAFDIVILDPPYAMQGAYAQAVELLEGYSLLAEGARVVCEREKAAAPAYPLSARIVLSRRYGDSVIDILEFAQGGDEA